MSTATPSDSSTPLHGLPALRHDCNPTNLFGCGQDALGCLPGLLFAAATLRLHGHGWAAGLWLVGAPILIAGLAGAFDQAKTTSYTPSRWAWLVGAVGLAAIWGATWHACPLAAAIGGVTLLLLPLRTWLAKRALAATLARWGLDATALRLVMQLPADLPPAVQQPLARGVASWEALLARISEGRETDHALDYDGLLADGRRTLLAMLRTAAAAGLTAQPDSADVVALESAAGLLAQTQQAVAAYSHAGDDGQAELRERLTSLRDTTEGLRELDRELGA